LGVSSTAPAFQLPFLDPARLSLGELRRLLRVAMLLDDVRWWAVGAHRAIMPISGLVALAP
jgi:hypothetical protein